MSGGFTHESQAIQSVEWYTPPEIFTELGVAMFDLDPCSPGADIVPWIPARKHYTVRDNGFIQPWDGLVWLNPPYGNETGDWLRRLRDHGNGIALVFARTDTVWFHDVAKDADLLCFLRGRVRFIASNGRRADTPGCGSMLIAFGAVAEKAVRRYENTSLGLCVRWER